MAVRQRTADANGRGTAWALRVFRSLWTTMPLRRRAHLTESLDGGPVEGAELARNLADLARIGRLPGGTRASVGAIRRLAPARGDISIIDVGAGRGDMALAFARRGWRTVAIDSHPDVLRLAHATAMDPLVEVVDADGRSLPYADDAFHISHCSLLIHHLDPPDAVGLLREMARVARHGVVINDLRRGLPSFVATGVTVALLSRCRTTRVDGLISARRAYTLAELDDLLEEAGLEVVWRSAPFMPRVATAAVRRTVA